MPTRLGTQRRRRALLADGADDILARGAAQQVSQSKACNHEEPCRLSDRHRPRRSRASSPCTASNACGSADVVIHDQLVSPRLLSTRAGRRTDRRRQHGAAADGAGSDQIAHRRKAREGEARGAAQTRRPVRVRSRRRGSAVPARARDSVRGRARHPARNRRAGLRRRAGDVPGRRRHDHAGARLRGRKPHPARHRLGEPRETRWHSRLLRGIAAAPRMLDALLANGWPADGQAVIVYNGTLTSQTPSPGRSKNCASACTSIRGASLRSSSSGAWSRFRDHLRWFDARPLFGKRVLVTRPRDQAARDGRPADGAGRRSDRSADDPHRAA